MAKVFLSYSSSDSKYVTAVAEKLGKNRAIIDTFSFEVGSKTFDEILKGLDNADLFVIFLSSAALDSVWVKKELNIAYEKFNFGKIKQIFPIIIDENITHKDIRIPEWMREGFDSYNIRRIDSPSVAFRKIETRLNELKYEFSSVKDIYVGHETELFDFKKKLFETDALTCIIASGFDGIGRTSFIKQCLLTTGDYSKNYNPIIIDFGKNQSIDDMIFKLVEVGYGKEDIVSLKNKKFDEKINILTEQLTQIQDFKEFVVFKDDGGLIVNQDVIDWLNRALAKLKPGLTFGIATRQHLLEHKIKNAGKIFCSDIKELDDTNKIHLLQKLTKLSREETREFSECLSGHPLQINFCANIINDIGYEETRAKNMHILKDNAFQNAAKIVASVVDFLGYTTDEQKDILNGYMAFLANYPNVPVKTVLEVNNLNPEYAKIYDKLLSLCVCQKIGATKDIVSTSPLICEYFDRHRIEKAGDIQDYLNREFQTFRKNLSSVNLDDYCYSQLDFNLKNMIISDINLTADFKYFYPSLIVRSIIELYNGQKYDKVIELCKTTLNDSKYWDYSLLNTFYYFYSMALAHKRDKKAIELVHAKNINGREILDSNQINFIIGFYYKFTFHYDDALKKFLECIEKSRTYFAARREIVEVYTTLEDYESALNYAKKNYADYPDNSFNIYQYFKCCIHQQKTDRILLDELLKQLYESESVVKVTRKLYPEAQTLYYRFVEHDMEKAINFLQENAANFVNKIHYYKNLFDLYEEKRDVENMREALSKLEELVKEDKTYYPVLIRRQTSLMYFDGKSYDSIVSSLSTFVVGDHAKKQVIRHLDYLFKKI